MLVVEDERLLADTIAEGLRRQAMAVDVAYDGDQALQRLSVNDYDVVVLDRDLPMISGDQVCSTLVDAGVDTRILMLTAATAVAQRVAGLGLGADESQGGSHGGSGDQMQTPHRGGSGQGGSGSSHGSGGSHDSRPGQGSRGNHSSGGGR